MRLTMAQLEKCAPILRARALRMINAAHAGHPGGSLSVIDMLAAVMLGWGRFAQDEDPKDWMVLGKGHAAPALYAVLAELGYLQDEELKSYRRLGSRLQGHPDRLKLPFVQVSTGHLGQGLSIALGLSIGEKRLKSGRHVFAILGEGDLHEGQTWEAAMAASHFRAEGLYALVDCNGLTQQGRVDRLMNVEPLARKWEAFGWWVREADGHDYAQLLTGLEEARGHTGPAVLLCRTVKGKGVTFMEGDPVWHSCDLPDELLAKALAQLGVRG